MDRETRFEDREDAPFLSQATTALPSPTSQDPTKALKKLPTNKLRIRLMVTLLGVILLVETGFAMTQGPVTRILESIVCKNYYLATDPTKIGSDGEVPENLCKVNEIQGEVAIIKGYGEFFDGLASMY
jgi:hypothetical protein